MTNSSPNAELANSIDAVMRRVSAVSRFYELNEIRFVDCRFSYLQADENSTTELSIGVVDQLVQLEGTRLLSSMRFEMLGPSPFNEEPKKRVSISAKLIIEYERPNDRGDATVATEDAQAFGRVNGIYNAWPYIREYVQSCLLRLGLPPFELPLLRAPAAAQLAGFVNASNQPLATEPK